MRLHSEPALFHIVQENRAVVFKRWAVARSHPLGSRIRAVLLPCEVLRKVFRGKFVHARKRAFRNGQLCLHEDLTLLNQPKRFAAQLRRTSTPYLPSIEFALGPRPPQPRAAPFKAMYRKHARASRFHPHSFVDARFRYITRTSRY